MRGPKEQIRAPFSPLVHCTVPSLLFKDCLGYPTSIYFPDIVLMNITEVNKEVVPALEGLQSKKEDKHISRKL